MLKYKNLFHSYTIRLYLFLGVGSVLMTSCQQKPSGSQLDYSVNWKASLQDKISRLGHRNWILVVDKAYPIQNSPGMEYVFVNEKILPVLQEVIENINSSDHVRPTIFIDKELGFVNRGKKGEMKNFIERTKQILGPQNTNAILHDSVFKMMDKEASLFSTLVIKTQETIPYSSVFIKLDCKYWSSIEENRMRTLMLKGQ